MFQRFLDWLYPPEVLHHAMAGRFPEMGFNEQWRRIQRLQFRNDAFRALVLSASLSGLAYWLL